MFCPRCSAQNRQEQKYCRNCGLSLSSVRLAIEGKIDEAKAELKLSYDNLRPAVWTMGFFVLAALCNLFIGWEWGIAINLFMGALITIGWFRKGFKQMGRVLKMLEGKVEEQDAHPAIASTNEPASQAQPISQAELLSLPVPDTDPILTPPAGGSIAEHTTFELKTPEPRR